MTEKTEQPAGDALLSAAPLAATTTVHVPADVLPRRADLTRLSRMFAFSWVLRQQDGSTTFAFTESTVDVHGLLAALGRMAGPVGPDGEDAIEGRDGAAFYAKAGDRQAMRN